MEKPFSTILKKILLLKSYSPGRHQDQFQENVFICLVYFIFIISFSNKIGVILSLSFPIILFIYLPRIIRRPEFELEVTRNESFFRGIEGESIAVSWQVKNSGGYIPEIKLEEELPDGLDKIGGISSLITSLKSNSVCSIEFEVKGKCGTYRLPGLTVQEPVFLGLKNRSRTYDLSAEVVIVPQTYSTKGMTVNARRLMPQIGFNLSRKGGEGMELFGVREYHPGDSLRFINGRASARHPQSLFIQEFEQEKITTVVLFLDTQHWNSAANENSIFKKTLEGMVLLSEGLLNSGNRVGLYVYGNYQSWVFPAAGKIQKERILRGLTLNHDNRNVWKGQLTDLPARFLPHGSMVIACSFLLGSNLQMLHAFKSRHFQLMVISPDEPYDIKSHLNAGKAMDLAIRTANIERRLLIRSLVNQSIPVLDWKSDTSFESSVKRFLETNWQ